MYIRSYEAMDIGIPGSLTQYIKTNGFSWKWEKKKYGIPELTMKGSSKREAAGVHGFVVVVHYYC